VDYSTSSAFFLSFSTTSGGTYFSQSAHMPHLVQAMKIAAAGREQSVLLGEP
jgi:hypothetical protein